MLSVPRDPTGRISSRSKAISGERPREQASKCCHPRLPAPSPALWTTSLSLA